MSDAPPTSINGLGPALRWLSVADYRRRKLPNLVAEAIIRNIVESGWSEGAALGTEQELIDRYGVSRATLREAVRELERHGAAIMRRGHGLLIAAPPRETIVAVLAGFIRPGEASVPDIDAVRDMLVGGAREMPSDNPVIALLLDALAASEPTGQAPASAGKPKLAAGTASAIADAVAAYPVGHRIGTEADMAKSYRVSRATLREALALLESQGLITRRRGIGGGLFKSEPDPRSAAEMAATYLHYMRPDVDAVTDARQLLETEAAAIAADIATPAQIGWLGETVMREPSADPDALERNREFHTRLAAISGNAALALFVEVLMRSFYVVRHTPGADFLNGLAASHLAIYRAVEAKDAAAARAAMIDHLDFARRWMRAGLLTV